MKKAFFIIFSIITLLSSCDKNRNEIPSINIHKVLRNGEIIDKDNININPNDTLSLVLSLKASKKDINSFTTKFKDLNNYALTITGYDESTTYVEGNPVATTFNEDCTVLFKDGTYDADVTIKTVIKEEELEATKLYLYLFSEKETATEEIDIKMCNDSNE